MIIKTHNWQVRIQVHLDLAQGPESPLKSCHSYGLVLKHDPEILHVSFF